MKIIQPYAVAVLSMVLLALVATAADGIREASQSSTFEQAAADLALDGNIDGNYQNGSVAMARRDPYAYWWVDLGAATPVSSVTVHGRTDAHANRLDHFILVALPDSASPATDPILSTPERRQLSDPGFAPDGWVIHRSIRSFTAADASEDVPGGVSVRYLYVMLPRADYLQLAEVVVPPG